MEMEIEELRRQRDLAQSQADELRQKLEREQQVSLSVSLALSILRGPSPFDGLYTYLRF